jgi:hypothetical protein
VDPFSTVESLVELGTYASELLVESVAYLERKQARSFPYHQKSNNKAFQDGGLRWGRRSSKLLLHGLPKSSKKVCGVASAALILPIECNVSAHQNVGYARLFARQTCEPPLVLKTQVSRLCFEGFDAIGRMRMSMSISSFQRAIFVEKFRRRHLCRLSLQRNPFQAMFCEEGARY